MRQVVFVASALFLIACGPDPNAQLPGLATPAKTGGASGSGGRISGTGGAAQGGGGVFGSGGVTPAKGGSGGGNPFGGGTTGSTGGVVSSGGVVGSGGIVVGSGGVLGTGGGFGAGGVASTGGVAGSGGVVGAGGTTTAGSGALTTYTFGSGAEPCTPALDISGGQSGQFKTKGAFCFRTADDFSDYGCSSTDGRTLKINGTAVTTCGGKPPAKVGSFYYFDFSAGTWDYASVNWYCSNQSCQGALGTHPVPSCGHYPPWVSGGSAAPCSDTPPAADASVSAPGVDSGS